VVKPETRGFEHEKMIENTTSSQITFLERSRKVMNGGLLLGGSAE
jgi:hypothetical protein